jgi:hypothetical protein
MNFSGKIIKNYIIKEKISEDSISTSWIAYSIYSVKIYLIKFFNKKSFKLDKSKITNYHKKLENKKTDEYTNILEIYDYGKYENYNYILTELNEGELLLDYIKKNDLNLSDKLKIITNISKSIQSFHKNDITFGYFSLNDIWLEIFYNNIQKIKLLNNGYDILNEDISIKEIENLKNYLFKIKKNKSHKQQLQINKKNDLIYIGINLYKILSNDYELKRIQKKDLEKHLKNSLKKIKNKKDFINILLKLLLKKTQYKNIDDLINQLNKLSDVSLYGFNGIDNREQKKYEDIFEERRNYFNKLEEERKERLEKSHTELDYASNKTEINNETSLQDDEDFFKERKNYFETHEKERKKYLNDINELREKHIDKIINQTKNYFANIDKNKSNNIEYDYSSYFDNLTNEMKKFVDDLETENIKYFNILNNTNTNRYVDKK